MAAVINPPAQPGRRGKHFLVNVLWSWASIAVMLFSAVILSPFVIRRLGDENFGLWALTLSLVEYYWLLDFGLRSAAVKYSAHYNAIGAPEKVNELVNTALFYSCLLAPVLIAGTVLLTPHLEAWFHVQNQLFPKLVTIVVVTWILGSVFNIYISCLEGFQRFDLTSQVGVVTTAVRSFGTAALLLAGYGILHIALMSLAAQTLQYTLSFFAFRRVFPEARFSRRFVKFSMLRQMLAYGSHSVIASLAQRTLNQSTPLLIGYFLPTRFVGYYAASTRVLEYTGEAIGRVGMVSNSNAAELVAQGRHEDLLRLSTETNRYSLAIYLPLTIFLAVYGPALLAVWIKPEFAAHSSGVLLAMLAGVTIANAGQYNSGSILFGMGRHQGYARALLIEAALGVCALLFVIPRFGIVGAAWVNSGLMLLNRGLFSAWLLSAELKTSYAGFLARVYQPLIVAAPVGAALYAIRTVMPGKNWKELICAGAITCFLYFPLMFRFCLRPDHQSAVLNAVKKRVLRIV